MAIKTVLSIKNLHVSVNKTAILKGVDFSANSGEIHAIMGPNGSGKSTMALTMAGHPKYKITKGSIEFENKDLSKFSVDKRSKAGIFLAFQNPNEIEGVNLKEFLYQTYKSKFTDSDHIEFEKLLVKNLELLKINPKFLERSVNFGLSGGEKKQAETLQLAMLRPKLAILDEIDSGLDVDALKNISDGLNKIKGDNPEMSLIIITHYPRILKYIIPDFVHVMQNGKIRESGTMALAEKIESYGYNNQK